MVIMDKSTNDAADALKQYEETAKRRTLWPPMPVKSTGGEPWRPVMNEQERQEHERYIQDNGLPF